MVICCILGTGVVNRAGPVISDDFAKSLKRFFETGFSRGREWVHEVNPSVEDVRDQLDEGRLGMFSKYPKTTGSLWYTIALVRPETGSRICSIHNLNCKLL